MKIAKTFILFFCLLTFQEVNSQYVYNWFPVQTGTGSNLNYIYFTNNNLWLVGSAGAILYSTNQGFNWSSQNSGTNNELRSIYDFGNKFICGAGGMILKSTNNGTSWFSLTSGTGQTLNGISRLSFMSLFVVGNSGTILISTNMGSSWQTVSSGTSVNLNSITGYGNYGWIAGANGLIMASTDAGLTWVSQSSGTVNNLNYIVSFDMNNVWAVGDNGTILATSNAGTNWSVRTSNTVSALKSLSFNSGSFWIAGSWGTTLRSTNGGLNWIVQPGYTSNHLNSVCFFTSDFGLAAGNSGTLFMRRVDSNYTIYSKLDFNNINSWFVNRGIFDQDVRNSSSPGFEWPKGTGQTAIFSAGLTIAALYNGSLRMASAMYSGEYLPGYIADSSGIPVARTQLNFKFYNVKRGDNAGNNPDWANWGLMVPYGAPFVDVNNNGTYEPNIDTPGVKNSAQTIFLCMTDGFPGTHSPSEGFGGGTQPLYAEVHLTAWCYDNPDLIDVQVIKWDVINKSHTQWTGAYFSITSDPDLGCADDDYIGCDTTRNLGFCYNGEDIDCSSSNRYPGVVPAVGFQWLTCNGVQNLGMTSFDFFTCSGCGGPVCERDPNPGADKAYNYMKGFKLDGTPWVIPPGGPQNMTKYVYSGDPETGNGWCESQGTISGSVQNCGGPGITTGNIITSNSPGDRRMIINSGSDNLTLNSGDTQKVIIAQLIARGTNRKNSVTRLKILADTVKANCSRGFIIGVEPISNNVPQKFSLAQNHPNPFNPKTLIIYELPEQGFVKLVIYDVMGREIQTLVNEKQQAGSYKADWDGTNFASGIYFYKITIGTFEQTKKMVLIK